MYIYADIFILLNIILNGLVMILTAWVMNIRFKMWRVMAAAAAGSIYSLIGLTDAYSLFYTPPAKFLASVFLVLIAFKVVSLRLLCLTVACFYTVAFFLGGAVVGYLLFFQQDFLGVGTGFSPLGVSWRNMACGVLLAFCLAAIVSRRLNRIAARRGLIVPIEIAYNGKMVRITALLDTGNHLANGKKPVVITEFEALLPIFSEQTKGYLQTMNPDFWISSLESCRDESWISKIEIIPYRAVGANNLLLGFRPDGFKIIEQSGEVEANSVVIAIYSGKLVADNSYQALLNPEVMHAVNAKGGAEICA